MGDFLGRLGSEFKLGQTNGPMMTSQIKMPDTDLGNGMVIPGGTQAIQHPSARPTFLTSFLANLPSAIAGGVANSQHPGGGFATGLAGGFQGIEQHNLLMNQLQNQQSERQLAQSREQREQAQFQSDEAIKKQQLAQNAFNSRFKINFDDKGSSVNVFDQQTFQKAVDNGAEPQDALTQALTTHPIGAQEDVPKIADAIAKQAGIDIDKFTPAQMGSYLFAQREATRTHSAKPIEDFYNKLMGQEASQKVAGIKIEGIGANREYPVIDTQNNNALQYASANDINAANAKTPGRYVPAGEGGKALGKTALIEDIRGTIQNVRGSLSNPKMPEFTAEQRADIALALGGSQPASALSAAFRGGVLGSLTSEQQDYLINLAQLKENAMAMRSVLGAGQGSEDMRNAIASTIPGPNTPSKAYAKKQLDKFEQVLNRLERGLPNVPLKGEDNSGAGVSIIRDANGRIIGVK